MSFSPSFSPIDKLNLKQSDRSQNHQFNSTLQLKLLISSISFHTRRHHIQPYTFNKMIQLWSLASIACLISASVITAAPTVQEAAAPIEQDVYSKIGVFVIDADGVVSQPLDVAEKVRSDFRSGARSWKPRGPLEKRATIHMATCISSDCTTGCTEHDSDFTSNFCLNVSDTQCTLVSDMDGAHLAFWNNLNCNGNLSYWYNCGTTLYAVSTPGTNSVGFQVGC